MTIELHVVRTLIEASEDLYEAFSIFQEIILKWAAIVDSGKISKFKIAIAAGTKARKSLPSSDQDEREWLFGVLAYRIAHMELDACPDVSSSLIESSQQGKSSSDISRMLAKYEVSATFDILLKSLSIWMCIVYSEKSEQCHQLAQEIHYPQENWNVKACSNMLIYCLTEGIEGLFVREPFDIKYWKKQVRES